jgi:hypothetical protein
MTKQKQSTEAAVREIRLPVLMPGESGRVARYLEWNVITSAGNSS